MFASSLANMTLLTNLSRLRAVCLSLGLLPGILAVILYLNTLPADFVYDDHRAILKNGDLLPDAPISSLFFNDFWGTPLTHSGSHRSYRPLCVLTFRLNYALGEHDPFGYHLGNIVLHCVVTIAYVCVLRLAMRDGFVATLAGIIFACHPVHTEAVAGVVGRADLLSALFFLLSFFFYLQYCFSFDNDGFERHAQNGLANNQKLFDSGTSKTLSGRYRFACFLGAVVFALVAMLSKEHGIMVLGVCAVYHVFIHSKLRLNNISTIFTAQHRRLLVSLLGLIIAGTLLILLRINLMGFETPEFATADNPASESASFRTRFLTYSYLPCFNFWLLLFPADLSFDWSMDSIPLLNSWTDRRIFAIVIFYSALGIMILRSFGGLSRPDRLKNIQKKIYFVETTSDIRSSEAVVENRILIENEMDKQIANMPLHKNEKKMRPNCEHLEINSKEKVDKYYRQRNGNKSADTIVILSLALIVLPFIPATNLFFYVGFVVAERILYIPSMGYCLLVAEGFNILRKKFLDTRRRWSSVPWYILIVSLVGLYSVRTVLRNKDWRSEYTLYSSGISVNPAKAWGNLANILKAQGQTLRAEDAYKKALTYRSNMADVHYNLY